MRYLRYGLVALGLALAGILWVHGSSTSSDEELARISAKYHAIKLGSTLEEGEAILGMRVGPISYDGETAPETLAAEVVDDPKQVRIQGYYLEESYGIALYCDGPYDSRVTGKELLALTKRSLGGKLRQILKEVRARILCGI